jgi:murein DD-endopeptidase MepM/ murein hydrolase activator NlpD
VKGGVVVFADPYAGYGNLVVLQHANKVTTHYAHCESIRVRPGQHVNAGQIIATVGNTGHSTGPHLHFELRVNGESIDPELVFPNLAEKAQG